MTVGGFGKVEREPVNAPDDFPGKYAQVLTVEFGDSSISKTRLTPFTPTRTTCWVTLTGLSVGTHLFGASAVGGSEIPANTVEVIVRHQSRPQCAQSTPARPGSGFPHSKVACASARLRQHDRGPVPWHG